MQLNKVYKNYKQHKKDDWKNRLFYMSTYCRVVCFLRIASLVQREAPRLCDGGIFVFATNTQYLNPLGRNCVRPFFVVMLNSRTIGEGVHLWWWKEFCINIHKVLATQHGRPMAVPTLCNNNPCKSKAKTHLKTGGFVVWSKTFHVGFNLFFTI